MRDLNASSKVLTRLVVRNRVPVYRSRELRNKATIVLRSRSERVRSSRKTSASSIKAIAFHLWAVSKKVNNLPEASAGPFPISLGWKICSGDSNASAIALTVAVFPTPGALWRELVGALSCS
jgi:hypothetical protein